MSFEIRAVCPECQSVTLKGRVDPKFYVNTETGLGYCHHCSFKGKFQGEEMEGFNVVDIRTRAVFDVSSLDRLEPLSEEAKRYLTKRFPGIDLDQLPVKYSKQHHAIAVTSGKVGIKYRFIAAINDLRFIAEPGSQFGGYWLDGTADKLLIVEGEFDSMTAKVCGFSGTVLALQTNKLSQESINRVRGFKNVFLALDNDEAGIEGTKLIQSITPNHAMVQLPEGIKDLNELLQKRGKDECHQFLRSETRTELEKDTRDLSSCIPELLTHFSDRRNTSGDTTGWIALDKVLGGGLRPGELTVINAFAKAGKTSFLNNIVHNLALSGKKVGIVSFEMGPATHIFPALLSIAGSTAIRNIADPEVLRESIELLQRDCDYLNNIYILKRFGYCSWEEIEEWAKLVKVQHGIEYLVLDHAGFMVKKMTDADENQELAKHMKKLTMTLGLQILVAVQSPKNKDGLSIQTAYGGMAWAQNADNFIILERDKEDEEKLYVRLEAARYPGAYPSHTPVIMTYDRETCGLSE